MNSIKLAAVVGLCVAGQSLAQNSKVSYTLQLGGNPNEALWENPPDCDAGLNPAYTNGSISDGQSYASGAIISWAAQVVVNGTHTGGIVPGGAANLVYDLELHEGSATGALVTAMVHGGPAATGWFSLINDGNGDGSRVSTCGAPADPLEDAAFAVAFKANTDEDDNPVSEPNRVGRLIDGWSVGGPFLDFFQYPASTGHPADGTCNAGTCSGGPRDTLACTTNAQCEGSNAAPGTLMGHGAGYSKFSGAGCPGFCGSDPTGNTAGVGLSAPATVGCGLALGVGPVGEGQMNTSGLAAGTYVLVLNPGSGNNIIDTTLDCNEVALGHFALKPDLAAGGDTITFTIGAGTCIPGSSTIADANRRIFYNNSFFDSAVAACTTFTGASPCNDNSAIATDKVALNPGQVATSASYSSFNKSINGLMIDVTPGAGCNPLPGGPLAASNFEFRVGNNAVFNATNYPLAAAPLSIDVIPGGGTLSSDRIVIIWADSAITNTRWLRTVVKSTGTLGLATDNVFYFGIAKGDSLNAAQGATPRFTVNVDDEIGARNHLHGTFSRVQVANNSTYGNPANLPDVRYDYDKSSTVNVNDEIISRNNGTTTFNGLLMFTAP